MTEHSGSPLVIFNIPVLLEKALARKCYLKGGGYLYIEPTEAMTVIDVNSGKNLREKGHEEGALAQNLEAAEEIARLLRLRNISGMIMIDFISMKQSEHERKLLSELRRLTKNDPCHVHVVDVTRLGIVEVTRAKKAPPLSEMLARSGD
jgi:ribonuclease G